MNRFNAILPAKIKNSRVSVLAVFAVLTLIYALIYILFFASYSIFNSQEAAAAAPAWYDANWSHRVSLTIPAGKISGNVTNFPIHVDYTNVSLQTNPQADGDDIMFVDHNGAGVKLSHELISFDQATGALQAWVEVPTIYSATDTTIYLYYGNPSASAQEDPAATFNAFQGVWHLDENVALFGPDTPGVYQDSTGKSNAGNRYYTTNTSGVFGPGAQFRGDDGSQITVPSSSSIQLDANDFFISFWARLDSTYGTPQVVNPPNTLFNKGAATSGNYNWIELFFETDRVRVRELDNGSTGRGPSYSFDNFDWHHFAVRHNATGGWITTTIYIDGVAAWSYTDTANNTGLNNSNGSNLLIGGRGSTRHFYGDMDEFRIARGATGSVGLAWFEAEYASGADPTFVGYGEPEVPGDLNSVLVTSANFLPKDFDIPTANAFFGTLSVYDQFDGRNIESLMLTNTQASSINNIFENFRAYYEYDNTAPYDCEGITYNGTEPLYATASVLTNDYTFTGSQPIYNNQAFCLHFVGDVVEPDAVGGNPPDVPYNFEVVDLDNDISFSQGSINLGGSNGALTNGYFEYQTPTVNVSAIGTEGTIEAGNALYTGGAFVFSMNMQSANITSIGMSQNGSIDAYTQFSEVRAYYEYDTTAPYDCTSESFNGTELKYGNTANFNPDSPVVGNTYQLSGTTAIVDPTQSMCLYIVVNNNYPGAANTDFNFAILNPSSDVIASQNVEPLGTISPNDATGGTVLGTPKGDGPAWFNGNWGYRKEVYTEAADVVGSADFYMFPVPVRLTDTDLQAAQADADDIFFTNKFGTKLPHEIEHFDSATGELMAWVEIPHLYNSIDTSFYMYYGNSTAGNQEDVASTWDNDFEMVQHLNQNISGGQTAVDSTGNGHDSTFYTGTGSTVDAVLGPGFNAPTQSTTVNLDATPAGSLDPTSNFTVGLWFRTGGTLPSDCGDIVHKYRSIAFYPGEELQYEIECSGTGFNFRYITAAASYNVAPTPNTWYYLVGVRNGTNVQFYVNGTNTNVTPNTYSGAAWTANDGVDFEIAGPTALNNFSAIGQFDEVRFSSIARSAEWIETEFNLQQIGQQTNTGAEESLNSGPLVNSVLLNGGTNINLTENTTTNIGISAQASDGDGFADITSASVVVYRSGVGPSCSSNPNSCYQNSCSLVNCSGNTCDVSCSVNVQYFAEATDAASNYPTEYWQARVTVQDSFGENVSDTSPAATTEMNTLLALEITGNINFGELAAGENSSSVNAITNIENTGNTAINFEVSGNNLCTDYPTCSGGVINVSNQQYSTSSFTYGAGTVLTGTPTPVGINLPQATSVGSPSVTQLFWGVNIPSGIVPGAYTGANTISAINP